MKKIKIHQSLEVVRERERESNRLKKKEEKNGLEVRQRTYKDIGFLSYFRCINTNINLKKHVEKSIVYLSYYF